jgi:predicted subunit of tRNA(5-methylaminomethyl-2-thiouridylate) methyltransferase
MKWLKYIASKIEIKNSKFESIDGVMAADLLTLTERQLQLSYEEGVIAEQLQSELPHRAGWVPLIHEAIVEGARAVKVPFYNVTTRQRDEMPFTSRTLVRALNRVRHNMDTVRAAGLAKMSLLQQAAALKVRDFYLSPL